jgi:hypothetical protein
MSIVALVGVVGLYYRLKKVIENRRDRSALKVD